VARKTTAVLSPIRMVLLIAATAMALNLALLFILNGGLPSPYSLGQLVGVHLVAAIITALIGSFTQIGSTGAMVAIYVLAFVAAQMLLVLTDLT
jgi:hypothetical protein